MKSSIGSSLCITHCTYWWPQNQYLMPSQWQCGYQKCYAVLASFFQDDISCFMANDWFQESFLNSLYDFTLCSSCSSINSLAFFFQPALLFPPCSTMRALYLGPATFEMYSLWAILESVFQFSARNASQGFPAVWCSPVTKARLSFCCTNVGEW